MIDIIGKRFGKLVAVRLSDKRSSKYMMVDCVCDCGEKVTTRRTSLVNGVTTSCGCMRGAGASKPSAVRKISPGDRFGRLVVVSDSGNRTKGRERIWNCLCDCGAETTGTATLLNGGNKQSCGCLQKELAAERKAADLTGKRFGKLVANHPTEFRSSGYVMWNCRCDCGQETLVRSNSLAFGEICSCGCARDNKEVVSPPETRRKRIGRATKRRARLLGAEGAFTEDQIDKLYELQRGMCANCRKKLTEGFHRDHKIALSLGGSNDISNIELLCETCNCRKHAKDPVRWANENGRLL